MTQSLITAEGLIALRCSKPSAFAPPLQAGWRWLPDPGLPADLDNDLETCAAIEPVPADAVEVSYSRTYKDLAAVKLVQRGRLNALRDEKEATVFPYLGHDFDCHQRAVSRINTVVQAAQAALALGAPFSITWTAADDVEIVMTAQDVIGMPIALAQHADTLHQTCRALKLQVENATTPAAVVAVAWPADEGGAGG
ncbi:MAG TPA: DUF4376 domain-containing protein [Rhodocyclaceae bacterium]|nr:DUF4376 domain-containing protein [Rhodocyclaceae bacterium]